MFYKELLFNISTFTGNITDEVPAFDEVRLFALQLDDTLIRSLLKVLLLIKTLLRLLVERRTGGGGGEMTQRQDEMREQNTKRIDDVGSK